MSYRTFTRTWWKEATEPGWPNNLEPEMGRKYYGSGHTFYDEQEARDWCKAWNASHAPGRYSRKAEYEET